MRPFRITLKNYRCFEDTKPLSLELGAGFTALVGPNNSGKSSFLKFFYEARQLLGTLTGDVNTMQNALQVPQRNVAFQALDDQVEIFFNRNTRLLVIELELPATSVNHVSKVRLTSERSQLNTWRYEVFCGTPPVKLTGLAGERDFAVEGGGAPRAVDFSALFEVCQAFSQCTYVGHFATRSMKEPGHTRERRTDVLPRAARRAAACARLPAIPPDKRRAPQNEHPRPKRGQSTPGLHGVVVVGAAER